jgi:cytochrome c553
VPIASLPDAANAPVLAQITEHSEFMPKHITRLVILIAAFAIAAFFAKHLFTADSFFEYGHYRGNSVAEIASAKPKYLGPAYCESCHAKQYAEWSKGVHDSASVNKVVKCEVCHGAAGGQDDRGRFEYSSTGPDHPKNLKMAIPADSRKLCTLCHEKMPGRPAEQRQIVELTHAGDQQCTACHNPHSPRDFTGAATAVTSHPGNAAAGKSKSALCAGCHGVDGVGAGLAGPNLAGQKEAYIVAAVKAYATHARDNPLMAAMSSGLSDGDAENLAAYFSASQCRNAKPADPALAAAAHEKAAVCVACHGANGISSNPLWPNLAGQTREYLVGALKAYKSGSRTNAIMGGVAKDLNDADIEKLAANFTNASCK